VPGVETDTIGVIDKLEEDDDDVDLKVTQTVEQQQQ